MAFFRWLTFLLRSLIGILTVLLSWIYLFLLTLVFVLKWLSIHWEIPIMLLSQFPLTFHQTHFSSNFSSNWMPCLWYSLWLLLCWLGWSSWSFKRFSICGKISLHSVLLLLVNFVSRFRFELMYISLIVSICSSPTPLHGFQLLVLLP